MASLRLFTLHLGGVTVGQMILSFPGIPFLQKNPGSTLWALLVVVLIVGLPSMAAGAEKWDRYNNWKITSFQLIGLPDGISPDFQKQLALYGQRKLLGTRRPDFHKDLLAEDLARIRLHLSRHGYPMAKTFPSVELQKESRQLALLITVDPGSAVLLGKLELDGWPSRVAMPDTSKKGIISEGQIFRDDDIEKATTFLREMLWDSGFESAKIQAQLGTFSHGRVELKFKVDAGHFSVVDSVVIEGCSEDLKGVARRVMNWQPGRPFSSEGMRQAALDLRSTQLFGHVELETENLEPGSLLLKTKLEDARMRTWRAGIGTWSDNPLVLRLGWNHNNLFSNGVGFNVRGVLGEYEKNLGASVYWLGWLSPRARTSFGFVVEDEREGAFHSLENRLELIQAFRPNLRDIWKVGLSVSQVDVETFTPDPDEAPDAQGKMLEVWSDWKWDRTDNPLSPTKGYYIKVSSTLSPTMGLSESPYWQVQLDGVRFISLPNGWVLGGRMRAGASQAMGEATDLLANRRFYAGGYNTMRGHERRQLGPKDMAGDPRGGQFVALGGLELRFPLIWLFAGAVFVDSGQVWREAEDVQWGTISAAPGLALDLITPLGPLRISYAINSVNPQENEPRETWLFGIGYPW